MKSQSGITSQVLQSLGTHIEKYFRNYALEQFGTSVLDSDGSAGLKDIFARIFEHEMLRHKLDSKFNKNVLLSEVKAEVTDEVNQEIEDLQIQLNTLRKDLTALKKKKAQPPSLQPAQTQNQFSEFSFDQEISEHFELSPGEGGAGTPTDARAMAATLQTNSPANILLEPLRADLKTHQIEIEQLQRGTALKANIKDVCALVDRKANTSDVFKVFEEIKRSVEILSSRQQSLESSKSFADLLHDQRSLNQGMTGQNFGAQTSSEKMLSASLASTRLLGAEPLGSAWRAEAAFLWFGNVSHCGPHVPLALSGSLNDQSIGGCTLKSSDSFDL